MTITDPASFARRLGQRMIPTPDPHSGHGPADMVRVLEPGWEVRPHIQLISDAISDAVAGRGPKRVIVTMPPRHGKSQTVSKAAPVWFLNAFPTRNVGLASYEATFAADWGWAVREAIREHEADLSVRLDPSFQARHQWRTAKGGGMFTAGVGGPFTGRGFHLLLIDDPFKNWQEAHSKTTRDTVWNWYLSTAYTRLEPGGVVVVVMTRWHDDDLVGRLLRAESEGGEQWRVVNLPALAEPADGDPGPEWRDEVGRGLGDPLWPDRYSAERLAEIRGVVGSYLWAGMYQQRPSPAAGAIFKRAWFRFYDEHPAVHRFDEVIASWDMAFKDTDDSSFVVGQVWGKLGADRYLLDQVRDRMDFVETLEAVQRLASAWPEARAKLVEDKANGPAVMSSLARKVPGLIPVSPNGSKESRAHAVAPEFESGNVFVPTVGRASWVGEFIEELCLFPNAANDDQVDAMSQALLRLSTAQPVAAGRYRDDRLAGSR